MELRDGFGPRIEGDAGLDLRASEDCAVPAGESATIPLGIAVEVPAGHVGRIVGRSTTHVKLGAITQEGVIDSGYRGEIHTMITAGSKAFVVKRGERICQLIVQPILHPNWQAVDQLTTTERGLQGLGSSGTS